MTFLGFKWRIRRRRKNRISETTPALIKGRRHRSTEDTDTCALRANIDKCIVVSFCSTSTSRRRTCGVLPKSSFSRPIGKSQPHRAWKEILSNTRVLLGKKLISKNPFDQKFSLRRNSGSNFTIFDCEKNILRYGSINKPYFYLCAFYDI